MKAAEGNLRGFESHPRRVKTYTIKPRPPLRAFVLAAVLSVIGAVMVVAGSGALWDWLGGLVLLVGVGLLLMALYSLWSMRVHVDLDDEGFHVRGPGINKKKPWSSVTKVALSQDETHLVFSHGEVERTHLFCPGGPGDEEFESMLKDITRRLDENRGYRNFI